LENPIGSDLRAELGIPRGVPLLTMEAVIHRWVQADRRLRGYRILFVLNKAPDPPGKMPWPIFQVEGEHGYVPHRLWFWRIRYRNAPVYGECRWSPRQGLQRMIVVPEGMVRIGRDDWEYT
jgi:hypothetical protein